MPNFFIDKFRIPPFLLSIYQAAGTEYGVRWEVLAAINEIETDYGRNLNVSTAGAVGWMQFMPATWKAYGVDANGDRKKDPYNPVDAIFAAARYLKAAGADEDLRTAIFAYNHADWYVDSVLMRARMVGGLPVELVGSLTGLTQGRFPVGAKARYADDVAEVRRVKAGENAAVSVDSDAKRRGVKVYAAAGSAVVATHDGKVVKRGVDPRLGRFVQVRDAFGNTYTYAHLKKLAPSHPVPEHGARTPGFQLPAAGPKPTQAASAGRRGSATAATPTGRPVKETRDPRTVAPEAGSAKVSHGVTKERLFAMPRRPASFASGGARQVGTARAQSATVAAPVSGDARYVRDLLGLRPDQVTWKALEPGSRVVAGTLLGRIGKTRHSPAPHTLFEIRPAGRGAPRIDPKPILDGWKLLESTAIYRAAGKNPFVGPDAKQPSIGQILLMSKEALQAHVLVNPRIDLYSCGRSDVRLGLVDRRVLATMEFLAASGLKPAISSLRCGHAYLTASGNVSEHSSGNALDIAAVNGIPIVGHQGRGSITEMTVERLLTLQGTMKPHQIISLMTFPGADNTYAMADHADHIHVGFRPLYGTSRTAQRRANAILKPGQWIKLIDRLGEIDNPAVSPVPSKYALKVEPRAVGVGASGD